ncbi:transporter substrate-binding domain-containing protein [Periweissella cryptocerci]|uniref:Transporter substrate-binding domain-containing protein n=1 Tax=Periweissella cryptocerci TaxID=2506420 RepID=A0A4P6YVE6_9LACO|nr:transporter substrate-binding domain-containing protein [Periweissella cryptocerci]
MVKRKWMYRLLLSLVAGLFLMGITQTTDAAKKSSEPHYNLTTDSTYPPFEFQDKHGKYVGIDIDIIAAIAKEEHFTYSMTPISFNSGAQAVLSGQFDGIMAGMAITPERKAVYDFGTPYYKTGVIAAAAKDSKIKSLKDLRGKTVALKTGTGAATYALSIQKKYGFKVTYFNDSNTMYNDVAVGNTVATFEDEPVMKYAIKNGTKLAIISKPANSGYYGFGVKKGKNQQLLRSFNAGFAKIKANGTYDKIVQKYVGASETKFSGSKAETNSIWGLLKQNHKQFAHGIVKTLELTVAGIFFATIFGVIIGLLGVVPSKLAQGVGGILTYIFRGLPLLVLAFFIYIGIPSLTGQKIPAMVAGLITLTLNEGAYIGAFVKGGLNAVDKGQMEAARSLGMPYSKAMMKVIMPQGIKIMVPSFINQFIITLKDTSILSAIGIIELTQTGTVIISRNMQGFRIWLIVAVMYLVIITGLTFLANWVDRKLNK